MMISKYIKYSLINYEYSKPLKTFHFHKLLTASQTSRSDQTLRSATFMFIFFHLFTISMSFLALFKENLNGFVPCKNLMIFSKKF